MAFHLDPTPDLTPPKLVNQIEDDGVDAILEALRMNNKLKVVFLNFDGTYLHPPVLTHIPPLDNKLTDLSLKTISLYMRNFTRYLDKL